MAADSGFLIFRRSNHTAGIDEDCPCVRCAAFDAAGTASHNNRTEIAYCTHRDTVLRSRWSVLKCGTAYSESSKRFLNVVHYRGESLCEPHSGFFVYLRLAKLFTAAPSGSAQLGRIPAQVDRVAALERRVSDLELSGKVMSGDINQLKFDREYDSDSIVGISDAEDDLRKDVDDDTAKIGKLRS